MASSKGIIIVLAINDCASSITGGLVLSGSLMWLASLLGAPRVVGALATCRVTLFEPLPTPTDAWFPGPAFATASRRPGLCIPPPVGRPGALGLRAQQSQPWAGCFPTNQPVQKCHFPSTFTHERPAASQRLSSSPKPTGALGLGSFPRFRPQLQTQSAYSRQPPEHIWGASAG